MIKVVLKIDGMMCGMCESHINDCIRSKFNVKKVTSSHKNGETVIIADEMLDENALRDSIAATGYELKSIKQEPYTKQPLFGFLHKNK